jgi:hypothetical protein
MSQDREKFPE